MSGDLLLVINNLVLSACFVPTLLKKRANVSRFTAAIYVAMIALGAYGYFLNNQIAPALATCIGVVMWLIMLIKTVRQESGD